MLNSSLTVNTTRLNEDYSLNSLLQLLAEEYFPLPSKTYWINPNPTGVFAAQTITNAEIDLSRYSSVTIKYRYWANDNGMNTITIPIGSTVIATAERSTKGQYSSRKTTVTTSGVIFEDGHEGTSASGSVANSGCIPQEIICNP